MLMKVLGVALIFLGLLGLSSIFFDFSALRLILAFILLSAGTGLVRS